MLTTQDIRALFAQEAELRLGSLDQLLLELERRPADVELIRSIFREIHTLKGSSAIAGLDDVSRLAHQLEEVMEDLRNGQRLATPEVIDALLAGVDRLGGLIMGQPDPVPGGSVTAPGGSVAAPGATVPTGHSATGAAVRFEPPAPVATVPTEPPAPVATHRPEPTAQVAAHRTEPTAQVPGSTVSQPVDHDAIQPGRRQQRTGRSGDDRAAAASPPRTVEPTGSGGVMVPMERLDELVELLGEAAAAHLRVGRMLNDRFGIDPASSTEFNELSRSLNALQDRVMRTRMVPVATITAGLHRAVRDISRAQGKDIRWEVEGAATELDRGVLHQLSDSLLHLVRNAADHGIEPPSERVGRKSPHGIIALHARQLGSEVIITVADDGRGIDLARVREKATALGIDTSELTDEETLQLIFRSGVSTSVTVTDLSGRGVGLDVVHTNVQAAHGRIEVRSEFGAGAEFRVIVPITLAVLRCLVVDVEGQRFALPFHRVMLTQAHDAAREIRAEGRTVVWVDDRPVTMSTLAQTLGLADSTSSSGGPIVVLTDSTRVHAFQVDRLVGQRDVVLKGLSRLLPHLPAVAGASIEPDGSIFAVLDPPGLIQRARSQRGRPIPPVPATSTGRPRRRILVVDDALTVRELQRSILERAGFDVRLAIDGLQALAKLAEEPADLVLTDVEMPNMDGFALTAAIRAAPGLTNIPILILSSLSSEADRRRGLDAGADGFLRKSGFDESGLLSAVNRLLGVPA